MSDAEPREPQEGEEAALDGVEPDEALVEAADLLEHEAAPEEAVSAAEFTQLTDAFNFELNRSGRNGALRSEKSLVRRLGTTAIFRIR